MNAHHQALIERLDAVIRRLEMARDDAQASDLEAAVAQAEIALGQLRGVVAAGKAAEAEAEAVA